MINNENVNFDENDELTDEQYYSEDNDMNETIQTANKSSEDSYEESKIDIYDYVIKNNDLEKTVSIIMTIINQEKELENAEF